jgi:hypothetical protein
MSLHPSTHLSAWKNSAITGQIFINFDIWVLKKKKKSWEKLSLIKIGQE